MLKIISIDPSGTGTTGICLIWGIKKIFFEFTSKIWQEHYKYLLNLVKNEKPNLVLIETAYYETKSNKDIMDLEKLVGALECLRFHCSSQIIMRQNNLTKNFAEKLITEAETIPNLFYFNKKWIYCEEQEEIKERKRRTKTEITRMGQANGRESSREEPNSAQNFQELSQHQVDALIIFHLYSKTNPYFGNNPRISRNSRYC